MKYTPLFTTKSFFISVLFLFLSISISAQKKESVLLTGNITDSISNQVLEYANIMATDTTGSDEKIHFTMTDDKGNYRLSLHAMLPYKIETTYLGYGKKTKITTFSTSEASLDFKMNVLDNELGEVIVKSSIPPIIYKKDTILYNATSFSDGTERKLRELLQQMPGVEVDENNNVFVEGKRVTQLLVEGKPFFGGNSELAVKSLPADAVKTVEVLKEYNKVAFLSPVSGDNELAMNIQLKEDKKRFVFGEIKGSVGWEKRWDARSDLFYYSPKINVYSIGGHNNINEELLSMDQFVQLQGGMSKMMSDNGGFSFNNSDIFNHISLAPNSVKSQSGIAATGLDFSFSPNYQLNSYLIYSDERKKSEQSFYNKYFLDNDITLEEYRDNVSNEKNKWLAVHTDFVYKKGGKDHLSVTLESNLTNINKNQEITSVNLDTSSIDHALDARWFLYC
jgi:hypothetical protein